MPYFITKSAHYKSANQPKIVYTSDSRKDMLAKARQLVLAVGTETEYMVDCWSGKNWDTIGAVIKVGPRTAYLYHFGKENGRYVDVYKKVNPDGSISSEVTQNGIKQVENILNHWM